MWSIFQDDQLLSISDPRSRFLQKSKLNYSAHNDLCKEVKQQQGQHGSSLPVFLTVSYQPLWQTKFTTLYANDNSH